MLSLVLTLTVTCICIAVTRSQTSVSCSSYCQYCLADSDFSDGTYRITSPGTYCLGQDILFNPLAGDTSNPNDYNTRSWFPTDDITYPGSTDFLDGAYSLGFFAAVSIESNDVILDLQNHLLAMAWPFYLQQRFCALIEIGSVPFLPDVGPADFGQSFVAVDNVEIKNGELGLSSHHGIHSNNATNVQIRSLFIHDFEVAGIQLNGFKNAQLSDLTIGPSLQNVSLSGHYANARFLLLAFHKLLHTIDTTNLEMPSVAFSYLTAGESLSLQEIYERLTTTMDLVFRERMDLLSDEERTSEELALANVLFGNPEGLPDGSAVYGIVLNSVSVAIAGFGDADGYALDAVLENIDIADLAVSVNEVPAIVFDACNDPANDGISRGPFGEVLDMTKLVSPQWVHLIHDSASSNGDYAALRYAGNVLADAQIALYLYGQDFVGDGVGYSFGGYISPYLLQWAVHDYDFDGSTTLPSCAEFVCNGDIMFHTNKGVVGLRVDGVENVVLDTVSVRGLHNGSPLGSFACADYTGPLDGGIRGTLQGDGAMNTDVRGICLTDSVVTWRGQNVIDDLNSDYGDVTGLDVIERSVVSFEATAVVEVSAMRGSSELLRNKRHVQYDFLERENQTPFPNNFDICIIKISQDSLLFGAPTHLAQNDCINPFVIL